MRVASDTASAVPGVDRAAPATGSAGVAAAAGIATALASMSCCIVPLVLFSLGISGAWIANLTALEPYQPLFFAATAGCVGIGYYLVYRRPQAACAQGVCGRPLPSAGVKAALWVATFLVSAAVLFRYLSPWVLGV